MGAEREEKVRREGVDEVEDITRGEYKAFDTVFRRVRNEEEGRMEAELGA